MNEEIQDNDGWTVTFRLGTCATALTLALAFVGLCTVAQWAGEFASVFAK